MYLLLCAILISSAYSAPIEQKQNSNGGIQRYSCFICEAYECYYPYNKTCDNALACFTSVERRVEEGEKIIYPQKGCIVDILHVLVYCHTENFTNDPTFCCGGDLCNNDEFEIPRRNWTPSTYEEMMQIKERKRLEAKKLFEEEIRSKKNNWFEGNKQLSPTEVYLPEEINLTHGFFSKHLNYVIIILAVCFCCCVAGGKIFKIQNLSICARKPTPNDTFDSNLASGSGSGSATLSQRCMAQDVTLIKRLGSGRYGEVWQGLWHGEKVAVKIFSSQEEDSWKNEVNIYTNIALYHENVLGFKGSDIITRSGITEMWILSALHEEGSLYDFLLANTVTHDTMIKLVRSICSGLLHLHTEIVGSKGKPAIAHRDLKTRNILLTSHGTCVIADFGLAVVKGEERETSNSDEPINYQVGTKRYMAPEILDNSIKINSFESFKRADIYAFGLMLWEVCSRCSIEGTSEEFRLAYHDCVPNDPDFEDMKKVVCIGEKRPEIPDSWSSDETLNAMAALMKECWNKTPEARSTVVRVKKELDKLYANVQELQSTS